MENLPTVIVTGGAGYIGSHTVVELHQAGFRPVIVDNFSNSSRDVPDRIFEICKAEFPVYEVDCRDVDGMSEVFENEDNVFAVIHFAAYKAVGESVQEPEKYYDNNILSLLRLIQVMYEFGIAPLVFSSSCTVYGATEDLPVTEASPIQPANSPYGYTKQVCEQLINDMVRSESGLQAVTLRYFNPIGAHPSSLIGELPIGKPNNLVPFITQTAAGLREELTVFGDDYATPDGTCIRDYIHVVDLAKAHVAALDYINARADEGFNEIFNIGTGAGSSVLEVVQAFEKVSGQPLNYKVGPRRPGDVPAIWAASEGKVDLLGWKAKLSLEDALRDAWHWQQNLRT